MYIVITHTKCYFGPFKNIKKARRAAKFIMEVYDILNTDHLFLVEEDEFKLSYSDYKFLDFEKMKEYFNSTDEKNEEF